MIIEKIKNGTNWKKIRKKILFKIYGNKKKFGIKAQSQPLEALIINVSWLKNFPFQILIANRAVPK